MSSKDSCPTQYTVKMANPTTVAETSKVRWNGSFKIAGVGLDVKQENATSQTLRVNPDKREVAPRVCGDGDDPPYADRVQEK